MPKKSIEGKPIASVTMPKGVVKAACKAVAAEKAAPKPRTTKPVLSFACAHCGKRFATESELLACAHAHEAEAEAEAVAQELATRTCQACGKVCKSVSGLKTHLRLAHPEPKAEETPQPAVETAPVVEETPIVEEAPAPMVDLKVEVSAQTSLDELKALLGELSDMVLNAQEGIAKAEQAKLSYLEAERAKDAEAVDFIKIYRATERRREQIQALLAKANELDGFTSEADRMVTSLLLDATQRLLDLLAADPRYTRGLPIFESFQAAEKARREAEEAAKKARQAAEAAKAAEAQKVQFAEESALYAEYQQGRTVETRVGPMTLFADCAWAASVTFKNGKGSPRAEIEAMAREAIGNRMERHGLSRHHPEFGKWLHEVWTFTQGLNAIKRAAQAKGEVFDNTFACPANTTIKGVVTTRPIRITGAQVEHIAHEGAKTEARKGKKGGKFSPRRQERQADEKPDVSELTGLGDIESVFLSSSEGETPTAFENAMMAAAKKAGLAE